MNGEGHMIVLIVDDQTSVINGILSGIDWEHIQVDKVLKAYNAFEAREILSSGMVDIMLCDIEMPAENGLSLFRWVKEQKIPVECIFLTAHADFVYTKEAIRLGGFDYLLQPARYEDIESAILRAKEKIKRSRERDQLSSYGQLLYHKKSRLLERMLREWYKADNNTFYNVLDELKLFGIPLQENSKVNIALLHLMKWSKQVKTWESELIKFSTANVVSELFCYYGQKILCTEIDENTYVLFVFNEDNQLIDKDGMIRQLKKAMQFFQESLSCWPAAYLGDAVELEKVNARVKELQAMQQDNVLMVSDIFILEEREKRKKNSTFINMDSWTNLILKGGIDTAEKECLEYLRTMSENSNINLEFLKRFYQNFMQMVYYCAKQMDISTNKLFEEEETMEQALRSYQTVDDMEELIIYTMSFFKKQVKLNETERSIIDQIVDYIHKNIEKDIRRSEIAEAVYLSDTYISKLFKNEKGVSLKEYIIEMKMKEAKVLLRTTELPVSVVAAKVGYTHFSHFSQIYKRTMGVTPSEERESA